MAYFCVPISDKLAYFVTPPDIETVQFVFYKGVAELDDLILNTLGAAVGYLLCRLFVQNKTADSQNAQRA